MNHTGELTWNQRAWTATLWAEPAALAWSTAVRAAGGHLTLLPHERTKGERFHLLVDGDRHLDPPPCIVLHRCRAFAEQVLISTSPPRQRLEDAALDLALAHLATGSRSAHLDAVASLAEPIQSWRTTPGRLLTALERRTRVPDRGWLTGVITDLSDGANSVLEQGYLRRVERPHGLPAALRQVAHDTMSGTVRRDALVLGTHVVELDGRAFHQGASRRDGDLERDLDAATLGLGSTRLGWGQVYDRPCVTAGKVGALLAAHGWKGCPTSCGPGCVATSVFRRALASAVQCGCPHAPEACGPPQSCAGGAADSAPRAPHDQRAADAALGTLAGSQRDDLSVGRGGEHS